MYQVIKDGIAFYVQDEEKALKYVKEGYDVFRQVQLKIDTNGNLIEDIPKTSVTGTGKSKSTTIRESR